MINLKIAAVVGTVILTSAAAFATKAQRNVSAWKKVGTTCVLTQAPDGCIKSNGAICHTVKGVLIAYTIKCITTLRTVAP